MSRSSSPPPDPGKDGHRATTPGHRDARAEALQKALRDNLRRRKQAQAIAQPASPEAEAPPGDPPA